MRRVWTAITNRFEAEDDDRVGIVEHRLMIALSVVAATAGGLLFLSQLLAW
jgi:hypothetical protein